jgi:transposase
MADETLPVVGQDSSLGRALYSTLMCGQVATKTENADLRTIHQWLKQHKPKGLEEFARHLQMYFKRIQRLDNAGFAATV